MFGVTGVTIDMIEGYNILHDKQLLENGLMPYIKRGFAGEMIAVPAIKYDIGSRGSGTQNVRWIRAFIYPVVDCGVTSEVMLMHEDVTAQVETERVQQEREKQLRTIIDSLPALIAVIGKDYRYRFCNKTYEHWFGMPIDKIIGKTISEIIGPAGFSRIKGKFQATLKGSVTNYDGYMVYSDGTERYISATMLPNMNASKEIEEIFLLVNDRTPYKKAEEKALHHHTELAHLARLSTISELATGLAHELNQPLTTIKLLSGIGLRELENGKNYYKLYDSLEGIGSQAIRAGEIIRQLRSLVANKIPKRAEVNLNKLILETIVRLKQ